jgi:membrane fusion protein (multidrug efflux system)
MPEGARIALVEEVAGLVEEWASGGLESASRTVISARILARIAEVKVTAGDRVKAGDVLIRLDARDLQARTAQARDALRAAQAERDLARTEEGRAKDLLARGVGTQQRYDQAAARLAVAEAEMARARQAVREAETALSYAVIAAPVSGRVIDRLAEPGDTAAPGTPLLRLYDPTSLRVEAPVRESLAVTLKVGDGLPVEVPALNQRFAGVIDEIVPYAEPGARTMLVKVRLPADSRLIAGMFARVGVPAGQRARLLAPAAAVLRIGQLEVVTLVDDEGRLSRRFVTSGATDDEGRLEILSGLAAGDRLLVPS